MRQPMPTSSRRAAANPYAVRVKAVPLSATAYEIRIDDVLRFVLEGDDQWPSQWQLFAAVNGSRSGSCLALESEHFDLLDQLERGCYWMPAELIAPAPQSVGKAAKVTRYPLPLYLAD
ncbi:hypothetical protein [Burkholderia lata]|nr:hypothetical protein [Burkholderia lata]